MDNQTTEQQIDALTEGQELDRLVAEACKIKFTITESPLFGQKVQIQVGDLRFVRTFSPSSDWNDAMFAAEKAELFLLTTVPADPKIPGRHSTAQFQAFLTHDHGCWTVKIYRYFAGYATGIMNRALEHESVSILAEDKSGPVAVCKAILKMKMAV